MPAPNILLRNVPNIRKNSTKAPLWSTKLGERDGTRPDVIENINHPVAYRGLIFNPDWANAPYWSNEYAEQRYARNDGTADQQDIDNIPPGCDFYYTTERWHPNGFKNGSGAVVGSKPVAQITTEQARLPGDKCLLTYDESYGTGSQWGSDSSVTREIPVEYPEIYVEYWLKFDPNFVFQDFIEGSGQYMVKTARIGRFFGSSSDPRYAYDPLTHGPYVIVDFGSYTAGSGNNYFRMRLSMRSNPYQDNIGPLTAYSANLDTVTDFLLDVEYHKVGIELKMNSAANELDGVARVYWDGAVLAEDASVNWNQDVNAVGIGWNTITLGGNASNVPYPAVDQHEQWWALANPLAYYGKPGG